MLDCFDVIKERLKSKGYDNVQYLPTRKSLAVGKELHVFKSFFLKSSPCLFHSTCFYGLYHLIFKLRFAAAYGLYRTCFMNEPVEKRFLLGLFSEAELDKFIEGGIVKCDGDNYRFNFRFVPYEDLFLVGKIDMKDPEYAHVNYDSVTFIEFLRKALSGRGFKRALEVGCGAGLVSIEIARRAGAVDAAEINRHAVNLMDINARLNGFSNITALFSDCYGAVSEKYDLIVSDPPFELMPEEDKAILHRYGGPLGMEVALRIFGGLEERLSDYGEAVIFTNSYISNYRTDTLKEALREMFTGKKFEITMHTLSYQVNPDFYPAYRKHNINYSVGYFIHVKRADEFKLVVVPLRPLDRAREVGRLLYLYGVILLGKRRRGRLP